ncbi:MAG: hypothetical protein E5W13_03105 [Mesorhizobium sp.]|nr:MAG: hypothetical protein E5W13_03105 [Mesorhizobium sp.]
MTIAERQAREAYDRENPWRPMNTAVIGDGLICELLFNDMVGDYNSPGYQYFLDNDGHWYRLDPPSVIYESPPMNWRPAYVRLTPERRNYLKRKAKE